MNTKEETTKAAPSGAASPVARSNGARIVNLVIGDMLVFLIFATIGRRNHGEAAGFDTLFQIFLTALPFLAGWFIISPIFGAYRRNLQAQPIAMAKRTALAWVAAWPFAMILRGIFVDHAIPPWTFWLVAFIANIILLMLWRVPVAFLGLIRERSPR
jgi:hypothetical protein